LRLDYRVAAVVFVAVVAVVTVAAVWGGGGCEVTGVCLTASRVYVNVTGGCDAVVRVYSPDGVLRAETVVPAGADSAPLPGGLAPGVYRVVVEAGGDTWEFEVEASPDPMIVSAKALVLPNGTVLLDVVPRGKPCWKPYLVTAVLVRVNGVDYKFEGPWEPGEPIRLQLNTTISPDATVIVLVWDNVNPNPYSASVTIPR